MKKSCNDASFHRITLDPDSVSEQKPSFSLANKQDSTKKFTLGIIGYTFHVKHLPIVYGKHSAR